MDHLPHLDLQQFSNQEEVHVTYINLVEETKKKSSRIKLGEHTLSFCVIGSRRMTFSSLGLFTVAIFRPFSAHFQLHFWIIFGCLAEK
jgi:hypothetical protein